jgi:hypothetical protein
LIVVSRLPFASVVMSVPSERAARPDIPATGALTSV